MRIKRIRIGSLLAILFIITTSCEKKAKCVFIFSSDISNITTHAATCGGEILADGTVDILERGVCWNNLHVPSISDDKTSDGSTIGEFTSQISGLNSGTTYLIRAYYSTTEGVFYGKTFFFSTPPDETDTVSDIVGNVYHMLHIGEQVWMLENLKTTKYRDNSEIPNLMDSLAWESTTSGAYCILLNDPIYDYIKYYNYYAVIDARKITPVGWHVPDSIEWKKLSDFLGGNLVSGKKLKSTSYWSYYYPPGPLPGDNRSGFTARAFGLRSYGDQFIYSGYYGYWWVNSGTNVAHSSCISLFSISDGISFKKYGNNVGLSVRCIKD